MRATGEGKDGHCPESLQSKHMLSGPGFTREEEKQDKQQRLLCHSPSFFFILLHLLVAGAREQGVLRVLQHPLFFFCGQL